MTYNTEYLISLGPYGHWKLTGDRKQRGKLSAFVGECIDCGYITAFDSVRGFQNSSGKKCLGCDKYSLEEAALRTHESTYKYNAKKRALEWSLSFEQFSSLVKQECFYCGIQGCQKLLKESWPFSGLDRIDNYVGYKIDNVRPCCRVCNVAKNNLTEREFIALVVKWHKRLVK